MNTPLPGYKIICTIYEGVRTVIYRAVKELDGSSLIVKTLLSDYPSIEEITRLRQEYKILKLLDIEEIVKAIALEPYKTGLALILEDFPGMYLKNAIFV